MNTNGIGQKATKDNPAREDLAKSATKSAPSLKNPQWRPKA